MPDWMPNPTEEQYIEALREAHRLIAAVWFANEQGAVWDTAAEQWRDQQYLPLITSHREAAKGRSS